MTHISNRRAMLTASAATVAFGFLPLKPARAQDGEHPRPSSPESPVPSIETFAQTPFVDAIALSPDGQRVALITQKGDTKYLVHYDIANPKPALFGLGPAKIRGLFFCGNDNVVVVNSLTYFIPQYAGHKHEYMQAHNVQLSTHNMTTLFERTNNFYPIINGDLHSIKVDGEYRLTASNTKMDVSFENCLYSFSLDGKSRRVLHEGTQATEGWVLTPQGHLVAYSDFDERQKTWELFYNRAAPGKSPDFKRIYKIKADLNSPDLVGLGRDGVSVVVRLYDDEWVNYHEMSPEGVLSEPLDVEGREKSHSAVFHPTTWRLCGFSRRDDWYSYVYSDGLMQKLTNALKEVMGEDQRISIVDYAEDPRKMIVYLESATDSGSYYHVDFSTGAPTFLASNYSNLPQEWTTQKKPIQYKAADGLDIHGYLTLPPFKAAKDLPLIVLPHGGPKARDRIDYDWQVQALASRGYAVLQPNFRGSSGYGGGFAAAGDGEFGRKMQTDLSDGVRYLVSQGLADPKRVAIFGASYGGYAALAGATLDTGIYNCAVSIAGMSDLRTFLDFVIVNANNDPEYSTVLIWKERFGDPKLYDDVSPYRQAAKASCPILLIHGTDDTVVPIEQSKRMEAALKKAGKPVEFITYKGQDHWETIASARVTMMQAAVDFLIKHNPSS